MSDSTQQRRDLLREIELINQRINEQNRAAATASGSELQDLENRISIERTRLQMSQQTLADLNSIKKLTKENLTNFDSIDDTLISIGNTLQNNSALQATFTTKLNSAKNTLTSIAGIVEQSSFDDTQLKHIDAAGKAYSEMNTSIAAAASKLQNNKIGQQEYNELVKESFASFDTLITAIDTSTQAGQDLVEVFRRGREELESFEQAANRSTAALDGMNGVLDQMGSSGIPLARELSTAIGEIANSGTLGKAALIALGAAAGKLAYDYFGAGIQASIKASMDVKANQIDGAKAVAEAQNNLAFTAQKSAQDFGFELQQMAAQFKAASKTALFGKGLGSVGYAASSLQLAGISAETIASATTAASKAGSGSSKLAADMAIFAQRSGVSVDELANVQQAFKLLDGVSASSALNMAEGTRAMAEQSGLNVGDVMNEIASASEMALEYQIQSGAALAKQVIYAKSLGVSFNDVAKAGQSMVLNYKDSIKAEMSLSAMLGKNVDLSEVRAKFASGDNEGALKALQAQGLDPSKMNMFQQEAFKNAAGGMDLNTLKKISTPGFQEGVGPLGSGDNLAASNAKNANEAFLSLKKVGEGALKFETALIAATQEIANTKLQTQIADAWLNSAAYTKYLADTAKLETERSLKENAGGALAASAGGLLGNFLPQIGKMFKGGAGAAPGGGGLAGMLGKTGKFLTKGGGGALAGLFGGITGFMDKKEKGGTTGEAVGAGALQGGLAAGGAVLGSFIGPVGTLIGGFLGDSLGGWINENAPGVAARFGGVFDSVMDKFAAIGEKFQPFIDNIAALFQKVGSIFTSVYNTVNEFLIGLGFEEGLGSIFSGLATFVGNSLSAPFETLLGIFGFLFDIVGAFGQLLSGDFSGAWETLKSGFSDLIDTIIGPFLSTFDMIYNSIAKLYNGIANSALGETLGLGKMELRPETTSVAASVQTKAATAAQKPVVAATTENTKVAQKAGTTLAAVEKDMKFAGNVQNEMVVLLATNAALLQQIAENTMGDKTINLDGKVVNKTLVANQRKAYSMAKA